MSQLSHARFLAVLSLVSVLGSVACGGPVDGTDDDVDIRALDDDDDDGDDDDDDTFMPGDGDGDGDGDEEDAGIDEAPDGGSSPDAGGIGGDGDGDGDGDEEDAGIDEAPDGGSSPDAGSVGGDGDGGVPDGCGNGIREPEEVCDGDQLHGQTCNSQGFTEGTLGCAANCQAFNTSACSICGDGVAEGAEHCDGDDTGAETCAGLGFAFGGTLRCNANCQLFDASGCAASTDVAISTANYNYVLPGAALADDGRVYVATDEGIHAFENDGTEAWFYAAVDVSSTVTLLDETRIAFQRFHSNGTMSIVALNNNGVLQWTSVIPRQWAWEIAVGADGTMYLSGYNSGAVKNHRLFAISPTGVALWDYANDGELGSITVAADGTLWVAAEEGLLHLSANGAVLSTHSCPGRQPWYPPVPGPDGKIYALAHDTFPYGNSYLTAFSPTGGCAFEVLLTDNDNDLFVNGRLLMGDDRLYVSTRVSVSAFNFAGVRLWEGAQVGTPFAIALTADDTLYVANRNGVSLIGDDGQEIWTYDIPTDTEGLMLHEDGWLAATSDNHVTVLPLSVGPASTMWPVEGQNRARTHALDFSGTSPSLCGNGQIDAPFEVCDGANVGGATCEGGTVTCAPNCLSLNTSSCSVGNGLIFSEIVEGSSNNKAIEVTNKGGTSIADLSSCAIARHSNGAADPSATWSFPAVALGAGQAYVVCHTGAVAGLLAVCDETTSSPTNFNGDDALVLTCNDQVRDSFGRVGEDPGTAWTGGSVSTLDTTLRRKSTVTTGDVNISDAFDPSTQWDAFAIDTFSGLGQ